MLNKSADYVKDGGNLVYWINSVTIEEKEMIIERFLKVCPEFSLMETRQRLGTSGLRGQREYQRLYPHIQSVNGSFFAKLSMMKRE